MQFSICCFSAGLQSSESVCGPFKSRFSFPWSSIVFLGVFSISFQSLVFWDLISLVLDLKAGLFNVELKSPTPPGKALYLSDWSQPCSTMARVCLPLPPISVLSLVVEVFSIQFPSLSKRKLFHR